LPAPEGFKSFESIYGAENLANSEDWLMAGDGVCEAGVGVRIITAAPEVNGVMGSVSELTKRGIVFSVGHR
jgi:N-acetylglucosamine-6-phosphate deacetylase